MPKSFPKNISVDINGKTYGGTYIVEGQLLTVTSIYGSETTFASAPFRIRPFYGNEMIAKLVLQAIVEKFLDRRNRSRHRESHF